MYQSSNEYAQKTENQIISNRCLIQCDTQTVNSLHSFRRTKTGSKQGSNKYDRKAANSSSWQASNSSLGSILLETIYKKEL